jgi:tripartite-type tricarboxylate transporter receptor subunit TctC
MVATEEWKKSQEQGEHSMQFLAGRDFRKFLDAEYQVTKTVLTDLGYAKQP